MSPWWALVFLAVFLIGVTKSGFGSGAGLMIVPMATMAMANLTPGPAAALPLLLPLLIAGDLLAIWQYRSRADWRIIARLLPGSLIGIVLGSALLRWFASQKHLAEALINIEIGAESVFLVSLNWYREWRAAHGVPPYRPSIAKSTAVGAFAGVSSTLAHAAGPIIALHLLPQRLDRRVFVGTCALYFFLVNTAKLPGYWKAGLFQQLSPVFALKFVPLVIVGALFGFWINRRINDTIFSKTVYAITFVLGWYLLVRGVVGLR
jgi:uncharacterized membrane protein YfcA